jgi:predicted lipid-binding transport protein (Tim44 family)
MGNGFQFLDIILFAMIAAFLVLRLRSVLGRRDGHRGRPPGAFPGRDREAADERAEETVIALPNRGADEATGPEAMPDWAMGDEPLAKGLAAIYRSDPGFTPDEFLSGGRLAFDLILGAYAAGDTRTLKSLLSPDVLGNFVQAIRRREQAGETTDDTLVGIKSAEIVEAYMADTDASVTVKFVTEQINVLRDENGDVVEGDPNTINEVTDFWTFARDTKSGDPNWSLVATRSLD